MLSATNLHHAFGEKIILNDLQLSLLKGERVALVGQNGEGKSTLLKILSGQLEADSGSINYAPTLKIGFLQQEPEFEAGKTVFEIVSEQAKPDHEYKIEAALSRLHIDLFQYSQVDTLSGGEKRRVDLARQLVSEPDILFLDEPTNHLDFDSIDYLAQSLKKEPTPVLFISHDRYFIDQVATRIIELHHGSLYTHNLPYASYLENRLTRIGIDKRTSHRKAELLKTELAWLKAGVKARTTKQKAHIERVYDLKDEVQARKIDTQENIVEISRADSERLSKTILEFDDVAFGYNKTPLFEHLTLKINNGDRIGLVGPNGSGKTSLLALLTGKIIPTGGKIIVGKKTTFTFFEQHRQSLNQAASLKEVLCSEGDTVFVGSRPIHVASYLEQYLFDGGDMNRKVSTLSGGEQNRLMLAQLFAKSANFLLFDEPTNDLDAMSLSILEKTLLEHRGAAFIVSHDRTFLDRVCTGILAFSPSGKENVKSNIRYNVGNYSYYLENKAKFSPNYSEAKTQTRAVKVREKAKQKRSYKEEREYENIGKKIEEKEARLEGIQTELNEGSIFLKDIEQATLLSNELESLESEIPKLYDRWQELESIGS